MHHVERSIVAVTHALRKILRFNLALVGNTIVTSIFVLNAIRPLHLDVVVNFAVIVKEVLSNVLDAKKSIVKKIANKINGTVARVAMKNSAVIIVRCLVLKTNRTERLHAAKTAKMIHTWDGIINNALCIVHCGRENEKREQFRYYITKLVINKKKKDYLLLHLLPLMRIISV